MKKESRKWHLETLTTHNSIMFDSLIHEHNIISENSKTVEFVEHPEEIEGYFARKERTKYFIDESLYDKLPIRVKQSEKLHNKEDVITRPVQVSAFKIVPEHTIKARQLINDLCPFDHTNPIDWTILKIIALMGFISRIYVCVSTESEFGKTSIFDVIHGLTDKCPVYKPRSVPGVLNKITGDGNIVFDEVHECSKDVKSIMEEFALQVGGGKSIYFNGAMKSGGTKSNYNCTLQSITFLYNNADQYKNPEKNYFDFIFTNNKALDTRFLKFKLKGILTEKFDRRFNIPKEAEENKMYYISIAKELVWLQEQKRKNDYERRFEINFALLDLKGRRKAVMDEITWLLDMYCESQKEYDEYLSRLEAAVLDYALMISGIKGDVLRVTKEEAI